MPRINDPDILVIWRDLQELLKNDAKILAVLCRLESETNPVLPYPTSLKFKDMKTMAFVTAISPIANVLTEVQVFDQNGNALAQNTITWAAPIGEAAVSDMTNLATSNSDGLGFDFMQSATAPTETFTVLATWTDPTGVAPPVTATLTINLTGVVAPPPPPTALAVPGPQRNLISVLKGT